MAAEREAICVPIDCEITPPFYALPGTDKVHWSWLKNSLVVPMQTASCHISESLPPTRYHPRTKSSPRFSEPSEV